MRRMKYESPELDIRWFETEAICTNSNIGDNLGGDSVGGGGDDWGDWGDWGDGGFSEDGW